MNSLFLIGEVVNNINITSKDGVEYTTNFVIKNGSNEFEIHCIKELAREVYNNTSKGDIVAIQGKLCKSKNDENRIIIIALSVQEFRNEKTNARLANEISETNGNIRNNIFNNMDKDKIYEIFNQLEKIINLVSDNKPKEDISNKLTEKRNDTLKEDINNTITKIDTTREVNQIHIKEKGLLEETELIPKELLEKNVIGKQLIQERKDGETLV